MDRKNEVRNKRGTKSERDREKEKEAERESARARPADSGIRMVKERNL